MHGKEELHDAILIQIDKLQALSNVWINIEFTEYNPSPAVRAHYAMAIDDMLERLKEMIERLHRQREGGSATAKPTAH
ncbi:hypothetical protein [Marinobacterium arenosum]|uniref:hypothetical protein n=1 Tax=Marinobacterium arenosum TaxID=2862496 RepID=UPI001C9382D9|nr:hypothetical protein [Marinobacterium arenosum]MBY4677632.1 hypothetical protein [Marinobacterium arenosum]